MKNKSSHMKFGEDVDGYAVPVLNEREIRASAGILFLLLFISLMLILFKQDFVFVKYVIIIFLTDFIIRIFVSPHYSPFLIIGRLIVSKQDPEFVGAAQKKFAWKIGLALSGLMFVLMVVLNTYSIITGLTCLLCLIFLFFETAFGICLGCLFYGLFHKANPLYCSGDACVEKHKQPVQRTSWVQILIVFIGIVFVLLAITFFDDYFSEAPKNLKEIIRTS